jgi:hypothetical protein
VLPWMSSMFSAGALNQLPWSVWIKNWEVVCGQSYCSATQFFRTDC